LELVTQRQAYKASADSQIAGAVRCLTYLAKNI
jgi:hypothetical protein